MPKAFTPLKIIHALTFIRKENKSKYSAQTRVVPHYQGIDRHIRTAFKMAAGVSWPAVQLRQANISDRVACKFYFCRSSISPFRENPPPKGLTVNTVFVRFFNCLKLFIVIRFWETYFFNGRVKEEGWTKKPGKWGTPQNGFVLRISIPLPPRPTTLT